MVANEDTYRKSIENALSSVKGLNMEEGVGNFTGKMIGAKCF
jgi:hypothetical protein